MVHPKPRPSTRQPKLLTSYRCFEGDTVTATGFGRTRAVSGTEALLESPDAFPVGQVLVLEFLLDNNQIAKARGRVTRVNKAKSLFRVQVKFDKLPVKSRRLLARQGAG